MGTTESDRKPRVLIFHGMRMSGSMLRELMTDVLSAFADEDWDWTFVDAANEATGPPRPCDSNHGKEP